MNQICHELKSKSTRTNISDVELGRDYMTAKQQYRSEIGIIHDLSTTAESGKGEIISAISRMANVSYNSANEKRQLVDSNLVKQIKDGRMCTFFITEHGVAFFEQICRFTDMMRSANIRY